MIVPNILFIVLIIRVAAVTEGFSFPSVWDSEGGKRTRPDESIITSWGREPHYYVSLSLHQTETYYHVVHMKCHLSTSHESHFVSWLATSLAEHKAIIANIYLRKKVLIM